MVVPVYWVQRSADNLAYYALAKYVTLKNDNIYPHLPIVTNEIAGPPYPHHLNVIGKLITDGSNLSLNIADVQNFHQDWVNFINVELRQILALTQTNATQIQSILSLSESIQLVVHTHLSRNGVWSTKKHFERYGLWQ